MDFIEQNQILEQVEQFLVKKLKGKEFYAVICVSDNENGVVISTGTLTEDTPLKYWKIIASGVLREGENLAGNLDLPEDPNFIKPVEPK